MNTPKTRNENIVVQEVENEILIYDLQTNKAFCLNETSAIIWQFCDGKNSIAEITDKVSKKLRELISEELIWLTLNDFKRDGLLENNEQFEIDFKGLSRRQVIRKIGLASMIALPVVSSIVAPNAAMAASGAPIALLGLCPTGSGCAGGLTCRTCSGGICNGQQVCCTGFGSLGPGVNTGTANGAGTCNPVTAVVACNGFSRNLGCCTRSVTSANCVNNSNGTFTTDCICA